MRSVLFASFLLASAFAQTLPQPTGGRSAAVKFAYVVHVNGSHPNASDSRDCEGRENAPFRNLPRAVDWAVDLWNAEEHVKLVIHPGVYTGAIRVVRVRNASHFLVIEAEKSGTVTVTGADPFTNWTAEGGVLSASWTNRWGEEPLLKSNASADFQPFSTRQEVFYSSMRLYRPVPAKDRLVEGSFFIVEGNDKEAGRVFLKAWAGEDPRRDLFSAERPSEQFDPTKSLLQLNDTMNVTVRGIVFEGGRGKLPAVHLRKVRNSVVEDCAVRNASRQGFLIERSEGISLRRLAVENAGWSGFSAVDTRNLLAEDVAVRGSRWRQGDVQLGAAPFRVAGGSNQLFRRLLVESNEGTALSLEGNARVGFDAALFTGNRGLATVAPGAKADGKGSFAWANGDEKLPDSLVSAGFTASAPSTDEAKAVLEALAKIRSAARVR